MFSVGSVLGFPHATCRNPCLVASEGGHVALCTEGGFYILELQFSPTSWQPRMIINKHFLPAKSETREFDVGVSRESLEEKLDNEEMYCLTMNHTLSPTRCVSPSYKGFRQIFWSPPGGDPLGRCILAALTMDHRLSLYSAGDTDHRWKEVVELSELWYQRQQAEDFPDGKSLRVDSKKNSNLQKLENFTYSVSAKAIAWSKIIDFPSEPSKAKKPRLHTLAKEASYLAVAMRSGHVVLWKVQLPCSSQEDCTVVTSFQTGLGNIESLCWCYQEKDKLTLAVGSSCGLVMLFTLRLSEDSAVSVDADSAVVLGEKDKMAVQHLCWVEAVGVLVSAKESHLQFSRITPGGSTVSEVSTSLMVGRNTEPVSGISCHGTQILITSVDGILQTISLSVKNGKLVIGTPELIEKSKSFEDAEKWTCHGAVYSRNATFLFFVESPSSYYDHLMLRETLKVHIQALPEKESIIDSVVQKSESTQDLSTMYDILEYCRETMLKNPKTLEPIKQIEDLKLKNPNDLTVMEAKLLRYFLVAEKCNKKLMPPEQFNQTERSLQEVEEVILHKYFVHYLERLGTTRPLQEENTERIGGAVSSIERWLKQKGLAGKKETKLIARARSSLGLSAGNEEDTKESCVICHGHFELVDHHMAVCPNEHRFARCCQCLRTCQEEYRTCGQCGALTCKNLHSGAGWTDARKCTYCDGTLR